jgi:mono/diheme cytochrome c family protein
MAVPWKKVGIGLVALVGALLAAFITFAVGWRELVLGARARPLTDRRFEPTPAALERGRHLVEDVYGCLGCHSERDWSLEGAPVKAGREGAGHNWSEYELPWITAPNLTPDEETGIGGLTDDALARGIREGIGHDGRVLFPIMPYLVYRRIPDEDLASIVVYLRSRPPIKNALSKSAVPFPLTLFIRHLPRPIDGPVPAPDLSTPVRRGEYLVRTIDCAGCHTARGAGGPIESLDLAGGNPAREPGSGRWVAASNLTPDPSGIPYYDEDLFVAAMRTGKVKARALSPGMPWVFIGRMSDEDLKAIFAYLKTLPPIAHRVTNTDPPTDCKRCGGKHGAGDQNAAS